MEHASKGALRPSWVIVAYLTVAICLVIAGVVIASGSGPSSLGVFEPTTTADQFGSVATLDTGGGGGQAAAAGAAGDGSGLPSTGFMLSLPFFVGSLALLAGLAIRRWAPFGSRQPSA